MSAGLLVTGLNLSVTNMLKVQPHALYGAFSFALKESHTSRYSMQATDSKPWYTRTIPLAYAFMLTVLGVA